MPDTLAVRLNRARLHSLEVPATFGTEDSFTVEIENHGEAMHVHLRLDDALSDVASIATTNHYIRGGATERVPVIVHEPRAARGTLTVATAYGNETADVDVRIEEPTRKEGRVEIDRSLVENPHETEPASGQPAPAGSGSGVTNERAAGGPDTPSAARTASTGGSRTASTGGGGQPTTASALGGSNRSLVLGSAVVVVLAGVVLLAVQSLAPVIGALAVLAGLLVVGYVLLY